MLRLGSTCLELFQASSDAEPARQGDEFVGFTHLAFEVTDIEEAAASLQADGIATGEIADCSVHLEGMRVCFFNDPEGNRIELMQGYQDEAQA
jgi:catechol 2,3-dioxygenase-like lactoylglutathione lyase family enzyme